MHEGRVVRLLIANGRAACAARRRLLTPAMMRGEVFPRLPRSVRYGLAVEYGTAGYLRVTYCGRAFASFKSDGSLAWSRCKIPPGTPPIDSPAFREGHEQFRVAVAMLASTWTSTARAACGRRHGREASPRSRARRSHRVSRAGPSGEDGSGLSDSDDPAGRADARRPIPAGVRR